MAFRSLVIAGRPTSAGFTSHAGLIAILVKFRAALLNALVIDRPISSDSKNINTFHTHFLDKSQEESY